MAKHTEADAAYRPAQAGEQRKAGGGVVAAVVAFGVLALLVGACAAVVVLQPPWAQGVLGALHLSQATTARSSHAATGASAGFQSMGDRMPDAQELTAIQDKRDRDKQTPLIARCAGVDLRSAIAPADITGVLFHQASYEYALPLETELPDADYETVAAERQIRVNREQQGGEWLDADALHLWRTTDNTTMDTSIDLGALPGATVFSPVDGTVVLVKDYLLYDEMPDIEIHIQPEGRADLDCVLIHTTDPVVKAGDQVRAGLTPLSKVRDIEADLTDVQLGFFTPEGVGGNHTHVQVNDANFPDYREKKLDEGGEDETVPTEQEEL